MILILITGLNVILFHYLRRAPWTLKAGDEASPVAKFVAASAMILVVGVLFCGRMLPFLGNSVLDAAGFNGCSAGLGEALLRRESPDI